MFYDNQLIFPFQEKEIDTCIDCNGHVGCWLLAAGCWLLARRLLAAGSQAALCCAGA
jgi:hypothetical protein